MNVLEPTVFVEPKIYHPINFTMNEKNSRLIVESRNKKQDNTTDCVINAMEILGLIDSFLAEAFRIVVKDGINECDIEELFTLLESHAGGNKKYKLGLMESDEGIDFLSKYVKLMPNNTAIFAGTRKMVEGNDKGHAFLIAKDNNGDIQNIDLHNKNRICPLIDSECFYLQFGGILTIVMILMATYPVKEIPKENGKLLETVRFNYRQC